MIPEQINPSYNLNGLLQITPYKTKFQNSHGILWTSECNYNVEDFWKPKPIVI